MANLMEEKSSLNLQQDYYSHAEALREKQTEQKQLKSKTRRAITIGREPQEVFDFWRDFKNLSSFMKDLTEILVISEKRSHWVVKLQTGMIAEWDALITEEQKGRMISWQSVEGSQVMTKGTVWFSKAPADLGTVVELSMDYSVPGGRFTELITFLSGESPDLLILTNLHRLKALLETGEIPTTEGQSSGRELDEDLKH